MRTEYDLVFLGCSCYAMGCAAQHPNDCLILESGEGFGPEFVDALRTCGPISRPQGEGAAFYDELIARGVMDENSAARGVLHLPAVNVVLNRMALEKQLNILFRTRVITRRLAAGHVEIDVVCCAQIHTFCCRRIIDTRSTDFTAIKRLDGSARTGVSANICAPVLPDVRMGALTVQPGFLPREAYVTLPVDAPSPRDREALLQAFEARPGCWASARLLQVAPARPIWCHSIRAQSEDGMFIPGCGFADPVSAWAAGLNEREELV